MNAVVIKQIAIDVEIILSIQIILTNDINSVNELNEEKTVGIAVSTSQVITV